MGINTSANNKYTQNQTATEQNSPTSQQGTNPPLGKVTVVELLALLNQLEVNLLQGAQKNSVIEVNAAKALNNNRITQMKREMQKMQQQIKKAKAAQKAQKRDKIIGITLSAVGGLLSACLGIEAVAAVGIMIALQYSGAMKKLTAGMRPEERLGVNLAFSLAIGLAAAGAGCAATAGEAAEVNGEEGAEAGVAAAGDGAAVDAPEGDAIEVEEVDVATESDEPRMNNYGVRQRAAIKGFRFGFWNGFTQLELSTGDLQKAMEKKIHGKNMEYLIISVQVLIAALGAYLGGTPGEDAGGIFGQITKLRGARGATSVIERNTMLLKHGSYGASLAMGGASAVQSANSIQQGIVLESLGENLHEQAQVRAIITRDNFVNKLLQTIQTLTKSTAVEATKSYNRELAALSSASIPYSALTRYMQLQA